MAVAFRSKSNNGGASGGDLTVNKPSGAVDNDILFADTYSEGSGTAFTLPSGWEWLAAAVQNSNSNFWHRVAWKRASGEGASWNFAHTPSSWRSIVCTAWSGAITTGDPQDATADSDNAGSTTVTAGTITTGTNNSMNIAPVMSYNLDDLGASGSGYTDGGIFDSHNLFYAIQASAGASGTKTFTSASASGNWASWHYSIKEAPTATLEQEGFRFGVDDGNEAAHGWEAAQDTNITTAANVSRLLRVLLNATDDPAAFPPKLKFQKNGSGGYATVPLTATSVTKPVIEAADCTISGNNTAVATFPVSHPAANTGDLLIFYVAWDDSTTTTDVAEPSGANGETLTEINATPITDASTETRAKAWYCVTTGSWTATTKTFTPSATESWSATVVRIPAGEFDSSTPIGATSTSAATGVADTSAVSPAYTAGASDGGGALLWFAGVDTDPLTGTITGWTILQQQDLGAVAHGVAVRNTEVSNSESIASANWTIAGDSWTSIAVIVRGPVVTNDLYISASANIAAGGEATTARLTAPSGKSTSDFVTGRRWDNENGTDTVDITIDDYSEVEWSLTLRSGLSGGDYFDFRVYNADAALNTYTLTPRWTISSGATIALDTATLAANGQALTVVEGAVTKSLNTATLTATGRAISILNANVIILSTATLAAQGRAIAVVPGTVSKSLSTAVLTATGRAIAIVPGTMTKAINTAALLTNGLALAVVPGVVSKSLATALLQSTGRALSVVPGAFTLSLDTAALTIAGQVIQIGNINTIPLTTATLTAQGRSVTIVPGAISKLLSTAQITAIGQTITISAGAGAIVVTLDTAQLLAGGQTASLIPGAITKALTTALLQSIGRAFAVVPGTTTLALDTATLTGNANSFVIVPGGVIIPVDTANLFANGQNVSVNVLGNLIVGLDTAQLLASGQLIAMRGYMAMVAWSLAERDLDWTLTNRDTDWSLSERDLDWTNQERDLDWSLDGRNLTWTIRNRRT